MKYAQQNKMNADAAVFLSRMLPFMVGGMSFEQAGKAVLEQDKKLTATALSNTDEGEYIRNELMHSTYASVRQID